MQLIQIGETKQKTIMDLIQEMSANQFSEIERLKAAARFQGEKQADSSHRPALRFFQAPAVTAHRALACGSVVTTLV